MDVTFNILGVPVSIYELLGVISGLACVWLTIKQNIWCWPTGLVSVAFYLVVFYKARLYADMGLQVVYIVLQFYGWYKWLYGGKDRTHLRVSRSPLRLNLLLALIGASSALLMGYLLASRTDASIPYWDSTATALSLVAQWMLAKKLLQNWLVWITADVLYIGIFIYKELYFSTILYATFLVLATLGYMEWKKSLSLSDKRAVSEIF